MNRSNDLLAYSKLSQALRITPEEIHEHVGRLRRISRVVEPGPRHPVVLKDLMTILSFTPPWALAPTFFAPAIAIFILPMWSLLPAQPEKKGLNCLSATA
jgi:hypothetical protein